MQKLKLRVEIGPRHAFGRRMILEGLRPRAVPLPNADAVDAVTAIDGRRIQLLSGFSLQVPDDASGLMRCQPLIGEEINLKEMVLLLSPC
jgi:hypothetical protein